MGNLLEKKIVKVSKEPSQVSLAGGSNYIEFKTLGKVVEDEWNDEGIVLPGGVEEGNVAFGVDGDFRADFDISITNLKTKATITLCGRINMGGRENDPFYFSIADEYTIGFHFMKCVEKHPLFSDMIYFVCEGKYGDGFFLISNNMKNPPLLIETSNKSVFGFVQAIGSNGVVVDKLALFPHLNILENYYPKELHRIVRTEDSLTVSNTNQPTNEEIILPGGVEEVFVVLGEVRSPRADFDISITNLKTKATITLYGRVNMKGREDDPFYFSVADSDRVEFHLLRCIKKHPQFDDMLYFMTGGDAGGNFCIISTSMENPPLLFETSNKSVLGLCDGPGSTDDDYVDRYILSPHLTVVSLVNPQPVQKKIRTEDLLIVSNTNQPTNVDITLTNEDTLETCVCSGRVDMKGHENDPAYFPIANLSQFPVEFVKCLRRQPAPFGMLDAEAWSSSPDKTFRVEIWTSNTTIPPIRFSINNDVLVLREYNKDEENSNEAILYAGGMLPDEDEYLYGPRKHNSSITLSPSFNIQPKHVLTITNIASGEYYQFTSTTDKYKVDTNTFYMHTDVKITTQNLLNCLRSNNYLATNFNIFTPFQARKVGLISGSRINLVAKVATMSPSITINASSNFATINESESGALPIDSITNGMLKPNEVRIELDMYADTDTQIGIDDWTQLSAVPIVKLSKSYNKQPLWFDVNSIWNNQNRYNNPLLAQEGWFDAGTCTNYRFVAKRSDGIVTQPFYVSDVLYSLTGYQRSLETNDLSDYLYRLGQRKKCLPLTRQGVAKHVKGQSQYFNFILSREQIVPNKVKEFALEYILLNTSKEPVGASRIVKHKIDINRLHTVNSVKLDLDTILESHADAEKVAWIEVRLLHGGRVVSEPMLFYILPSHLYKVHDFIFLNSLGGWSTFNFSGKQESEFKATSETLYKTQTPQSTISSELESVYNKQTEEDYTVQTMPLQRAEAEWLKELSAAIVVYEVSTSRYVIVDSLTVKTNTQSDLFILEMKYHYSDTYNGNRK